MRATNPEIEMANDLGSYTHDPFACVMYSFPWGTGELKGEGRGEPRAWQRGVLNTIGAHLRNPATRHDPLKIAVASGHGIGKSALVAQIIHWGMSTCTDCKVIVTANTETQLRTKTWPEVTKWFNMAINKHWFKVPATSAYSTEADHDKTWRADAVTWSENNVDAFAGAHNQGKRLIIIYDEASGIPEKIWETTEGALTDIDTEIIWLAFGNPLRNTGDFRECFRRNRHRWTTYNIDSRDVEGTNKDQIQKWVDDYGVDSDFVKIRVRGLFPNQSATQFFSDLLVDSAMKIKYPVTAYNFAPVILTLDNSWTGDDALAIGKRQGLHFEILKEIPYNDNDMEIGGLLARYEDEFKADAVFIDNGYGTGVLSFGKTLKRKWTGVWFQGKASNPAYFNKRSEMYGDARQWLKDGGALPDSLKLRYELTGLETEPRNDGKIQIEGKEDAKARGIPSPNLADAFALSFAYPVTSKKAQDAAKEARRAAGLGRRRPTHTWMG